MNTNKKSFFPKINIKEVVSTNPNNMKCSPELKFENGSCIPLNLLVDMAEAFNKYCDEKNINDKIILYSRQEILEPDNYKIYLLHEFKKRFNSDQTEWLTKKFTNLLKDETKEYLKTGIFRPEGPQGKFDWLSTLDINQVLQQYEYKYDDFVFLGAVPIDFNELDYLPFKNIDFNDMIKNNIKKFGVIFNLDEHHQSGSHWVSLFVDIEKGQIYFSDSYAERPEKRIIEFIKRIINFLEKKNIKPDVQYNKTRHQRGNSECGVYSINFILRLLKGKTFEYITRKRLSDDKVNKCRNIYFKK